MCCFSLVKNAENFCGHGIFGVVVDTYSKSLRLWIPLSVMPVVSERVVLEPMTDMLLKFKWYPIRDPNLLFQRGVYSGKSDCLVLPKNKSFYGKPAKKVMCSDLKVAKNLWRSIVSTQQRLYLDSAYLKSPITTFCLTILMDLIFSFWVQVSSYLSLLQQGTTAGFPPLGFFIPVPVLINGSSSNKNSQTIHTF